jgi:ribose transport system permease protein
MKRAVVSAEARADVAPAARRRSTDSSGPVSYTSIILQIAIATTIFTAGAILLPGFGSGSSVQAMAVLASFLGIAALGQTIVVLIGGIDLSVPAIIGAGNVMAAKLTGDGVPWPLTLLLAIVVGLLVGGINGYITHRWSAPPLVVTLAMGSIVSGLILVWTNARLTGTAPEWLTQATSPATPTGPIPLAPVVFVWLLLSLLAAVLLRWTKLGRQLYAIGVNRRAASLMLVSERRVSIVAFGASGMLAALAGFFLAGFTGGGLFNVGDPYLFLAIAAVVVGGTSMIGGRGGPLRTVVGTIVLIELTTLLVGFHLPSAAQQAILGVVIVAVVATYGRERRIGDRI